MTEIFPVPEDDITDLLTMPNISTTNSKVEESGGDYEWSMIFDEEANALHEIGVKQDDDNEEYGQLTHPAYRARVKLAYKLVTQIHQLLDYLHAGTHGRQQSELKEPEVQPMTAVERYLTTIDKLALFIDTDGKQKYRPWIATEMETLFARLDTMLAPPPEPPTPPTPTVISQDSVAIQTDKNIPVSYEPEESDVNLKDFLSYKLMATKVATQQLELNNITRKLTNPPRAKPTKQDKAASRLARSPASKKKTRGTKGISSSSGGKKGQKYVYKIKKPVKCPKLAPFDERKLREKKKMEEKKIKDRKKHLQQKSRISKLEQDLQRITEETKAQMTLQVSIDIYIYRLLWVIRVISKVYRES